MSWNSICLSHWSMRLSCSSAALICHQLLLLFDCSSTLHFQRRESLPKIFQPKVPGGRAERKGVWCSFGVFLHGERRNRNQDQWFDYFLWKNVKISHFLVLNHSSYGGKYSSGLTTAKVEESEQHITRCVHIRQPTCAHLHPQYTRHCTKIYSRSTGNFIHQCHLVLPTGFPLAGKHTPSFHCSPDWSPASLRCTDGKKSLRIHHWSCGYHSRAPKAVRCSKFNYIPNLHSPFKISTSFTAL